MAGGWPPPQSEYAVSDVSAMILPEGSDEGVPADRADQPGSFAKVAGLRSRTQASTSRSPRAWAARGEGLIRLVARRTGEGPTSPSCAGRVLRGEGSPGCRHRKPSAGTRRCAGPPRAADVNVESVYAAVGPHRLVLAVDKIEQADRHCRFALASRAASRAVRHSFHLREEVIGRRAARRRRAPASQLTPDLRGSRMLGTEGSTSKGPTDGWARSLLWASKEQRYAREHGEYVVCIVSRSISASLRAIHS